MNMLTRVLVYTEYRPDEAHGPHFPSDESGLEMENSTIKEMMAQSLLTPELYCPR